MSRRTETAYKAKSPGKAAQDVKARDSGEAPVPVQAGSKCCGCTAKDHVPGSSPGQALIRGDLFGMRSHQVKASRMATYRKTGQKSAEAIVGDGKRARRTREVSPRRRAEHRTGKEYR